MCVGTSKLMLTDCVGMCVDTGKLMQTDYVDMCVAQASLCSLTKHVCRYGQAHAH